MPTVSIHLPEQVCQRLNTCLAPKQSLSAFGRAAIEEKLATLENPEVSILYLAAHSQELQEDVEDSRIAAQRLARRARGESKTYTPEEAWHELGLSN